MKLKVIVAGACVTIILIVAVTLRFAQLSAYSHGEGGGVGSTDGRYSADLYLATTKGFFGHLRQHYHLEVVEELPSGDQNIIYERDVDIPHDSNQIDMDDLEGVILWSPNSELVTYSIGTQTINVDIAR